MIEISIKGHPKRVSKAKVKKATLFFADKIMYPRLHETLIVDVIFSRKNLEADEWANCIAYPEDSQRPKVFDINVDPGLSEKKTLIIIAHEMNHVRQLAKAQLYEYERKKLCRWKDDFIDIDKVWYWFLPWEIESYGIEHGLHHLFEMSIANDPKKREVAAKIFARK